MTEETPNFDGEVVTGVVVIIFVTVVQFSLPFLLWLCSFCWKTCKKYKKRKQERRRRIEFEREEEILLDEIETAARCKTQDELANCVQQYKEKVQENEAKETRNPQSASLVRLISLVAYISFFLWLAFFVSCEIKQCNKHRKFWSYLRIMAIVMMVITPIIVLIESAFSHELDYIINIVEDDTVWSFIQETHKLAPEITFTVKCYHYENKVRNDLSETISTSRYERQLVVTFQEDFLFRYGCFVDVSKQEIPALNSGRLNRIKIDPHISLGDSETHEDFAQQQRLLIAQNRHRDKHISVSIDEEIPELDKRFSAYPDLNEKPWWIRRRYFWLATALFMTWPYRWVFRAKTAKTHYALRKKVYKRTTPPRKVDIMRPVEDILRRNGRVLPGE